MMKRNSLFGGQQGGGYVKFNAPSAPGPFTIVVDVGGDVHEFRMHGALE